MNWLRLALLVILLAIFLYGSVSLIRYAVRSSTIRRTNAQLQAMYEQDAAELPESTPIPTPMPTPAQETAITPEPALLASYQYIGDTFLPELSELCAQNYDTVAWLRIPGVVNLPIVYRDNTYYLDRDFYGRKSDGGTLFLDEYHPLTQDTQYLVIHGHNMHDGSMFGYVSHYRKAGYMQEHPTVYFNTLYRRETYEVVGVLYVPGSTKDAGFVPYTGLRKFRDVDQFNSFAAMLRENALYWVEGATLAPEDALLSLSTCYGDYRVVVLCRRVSVEG